MSNFERITQPQNLEHLYWKPGFERYQLARDRVSNDHRIVIYHKLLETCGLSDVPNQDKYFLSQLLLDLEETVPRQKFESNKFLVNPETRVRTTSLILLIHRLLEVYRAGQFTPETLSNFVQHNELQLKLMERELIAAQNPYRLTIGTEIEFVPKGLRELNELCQEFLKEVERSHNELTKKENRNEPVDPNYWFQFLNTLQEEQPDWSALCEALKVSLTGKIKRDSLSIENLVWYFGHLSLFTQRTLPSAALSRYQIFYHPPTVEGVKSIGVETSLLPSVTSELQVEEARALLSMDNTQEYGVHFTILDIELSRRNPECMDLLLVAALANILPSEIFQKLADTSERQQEMGEDEFRQTWLMEQSRKYYSSGIFKHHFPFHGIRRKLRQDEANTNHMLPYQKSGNLSFKRGIEVRSLFGFAVEKIDELSDLEKFYENACIGLHAHQKKEDQRDEVDVLLAQSYVVLMSEIKAILVENGLLSETDRSEWLLLSNPYNYSRGEGTSATTHPTLYEEFLTQAVIEGADLDNHYMAKIRELVRQYQEFVENLMADVESDFEAY